LSTAQNKRHSRDCGLLIEVSPQIHYTFSMVSTLLTADDVARQLRIKKYTVYELIKRGELPSSKVGKQVRVSQADIDSYLNSSRTGAVYTGAESVDGAGQGNSAYIPQAPGAEPAAAGDAAPPAVSSSAIIISGQDVCLDLLVNRFSVLGLGPALRSYAGCYNSLIAFYNGKVTMAAAHLWDSESGAYNYPFIRHLLPGVPVGVLRLAGRMQGFYVKKGNPLGIKDWKDLTLPGLTMINRERGCGTRILLDQKLAVLGIDASAIEGYNREASSHMACASTVAKGGAGLSLGCERGSESISGVQFIPLQLEWYDLVFRLADKNTAVIKALLSYVISGEFKQDMKTLGGYDLSGTGIYKEM
jgi:putative molybdopterin biosynthesis protein